MAIVSKYNTIACYRHVLNQHHHNDGSKNRLWTVVLAAKNSWYVWWTWVNGQRGSLLNGRGRLSQILAEFLVKSLTVKSVGSPNVEFAVDRSYLRTTFFFCFFNLMQMHVTGRNTYRPLYRFAMPLKGLLIAYHQITSSIKTLYPFHTN